MSEKIYVVLNSWCDTVIAFDNEIEAQHMADAISGFVEECKIHHTSPVPQGLGVYITRMERHHWGVASSDEYKLAGASKIWHLRQGHDDHWFYTYCLARDEQHALEIGKERYDFMVATYGTEMDSKHRF